MVARTRFVRRLRGLVFLYLWLALGVNVPVYALPFLGKEPDWLGKLQVAGWAALAAAPLALIVLPWLLWRGAKRRQAAFHDRLAVEGRTALLLPRPDAKPVRVDKVDLWSRLADVIPRDEHISFELAGGEEGVAFALRAMEMVVRSALTQIMAEWPGAQARPVEDAEDDPLYVPEDRPAWWVEVQPVSPERPITASTPDPLMALLTEIARLPHGVHGGLQVLVRGDPFTRKKLGQKAARLTAQRGGGKSLEQRRGEKGLDQRAQRIFLETRLLVWASAGTGEMARSVARSLARTLTAQFGPSNPLRKAAEGAGAPTAREFPLFGGRPWADDELATVAHLVGKDGRNVAPQLRVAPAKPLPPSPECRVPPAARRGR